jgi:hypothetical protein
MPSHTSSKVLNPSQKRIMTGQKLKKLTQRVQRLATVITLICTIHAYLASGHLISLLCQSIVEQLFKKPLL